MLEIYFKKSLAPSLSRAPPKERQEREENHKSPFYPPLAKGVGALQGDNTTIGVDAAVRTRSP